MGDRVLVTFTDDGKEYSPAIYMHWAGDQAKTLIENAAPRMRRGDASYSAARFCGECHKGLTGQLGLGLIEGPTPKVAGFSWDEYSHGDAGVYIVNVRTGKVEVKGGYGKPFKLATTLFGADF